MKAQAVTILAMAAIAAGMCLAQDVTDDPLHGCYIGIADCTDNGTVNPTTSNTLPGLYVYAPPRPKTGDLLMIC